MSGSLKFYADTHIPKAVAGQLRLRGVDIVRCEEVNMADAADEEHLQYATAEGRAMVTHDDDFLVLHFRYQQQNLQHGGIMYVQPDLQGNIGQMVKQLYEYFELIEGGAGTLEADIANQITYIG